MLTEAQVADRAATKPGSCPGSCRQRPLVIALASEADRSAIYRLRHEVYARELRQHASNEQSELRDALDAYNTYLVARRGDAVVGFVAITPPPSPSSATFRHSSAGHYSIDKYLSRARLGIEWNQDVYEVRILTVLQAHRGSAVAIMLMLAAARWVESNGGTMIIAIGRRQVMPLYRKAGLQPLGICFTSGEVEFEVMTMTLDQAIRQRDSRRDQIERLLRHVHWRLGVPAMPAMEFRPQPPCYHGGQFFKAVGERFDDLERRHHIINADVLDAWFDPAPGVIHALQSHLPWLARTSPPTNSDGLVETIAKVRGLDRRHVLVGGGSSDLIFMALPRWLGADSRAMILDPTYGEYSHVLKHVIGCSVESLQLHRSNDYRVDLDEWQRRLTARPTPDLVVIVNPNSPTGQFVPTDQLRRLIERTSSTTRFWIDETYLEYVAGASSLESWATTVPNVVVCKSMSKVYALSGLRVAYLAGHELLLDDLRRHSPPWAVSLPAQVAAVRALQDPAWYRSKYEQTRQLRHDLVGDLVTRSGLDVLEGVANFVLVHLRSDQPSAREIVARCARRGVFLRDAAAMGPSLGDRTIRIAVKTAQDNHRIVQTLLDALSDPGLTR